MGYLFATILYRCSIRLCRQVYTGVSYRYIPVNRYRNLPAIIYIFYINQLPYMTVIVVVVVVPTHTQYISRRYTPAIRRVLAAALLLPTPHTRCIPIPTAVVVVVVVVGGDLYGASTTHCLVRQSPSECERAG